MRTITKTLLTFDELSPEQQQKAIADHREFNIDTYWHEFLLAEFEQQLTILGFVNVEIRYRGFWSQGDGLSFTGSYSHRCRESGELQYTACERLRAYLLHKHNTFEVARISHHYSHENTIRAEHYTAHEEENLTELVRDVCREFYQALEKEYNYQTSDEQVAEGLRANGVEFEQ